MGVREEGNRSCNRKEHGGIIDCSFSGHFARHLRPLTTVLVLWEQERRVVVKEIRHRTQHPSWGKTNTGYEYQEIES